MVYKIKRDIGGGDTFQKVIIDANRNLKVDEIRFGTLVDNFFYGSLGANASNGYTSGGMTFPASPRNTIDNFPFSSDANASDVGDLSVDRGNTAGQSSLTHGYTSGGNEGSPGSISYSNIIDKYPFAENANATDVGDLTVSRRHITSQSSRSNGYTSGGRVPPNPTNSDVIDKFPFASNGNATDVGNLLAGNNLGTGQSSESFGYYSGGYISDAVDVIQKFPFSSDANSTDVGNLATAKSQGAGNSSESHGYDAGGTTSSNQTGMTSIIDKFPFASDANATDAADLTQSRYLIGSSQSSKSHGYVSGGYVVPEVNTIDKYIFSADFKATDVGDLTQVRHSNAGQQG